MTTKRTSFALLTTSLQQSPPRLRTPATQDKGDTLASAKSGRRKASTAARPGLVTIRKRSIGYGVREQCAGSPPVRGLRGTPAIPSAGNIARTWTTTTKVSPRARALHSSVRVVTVGSLMPIRPLVELIWTTSSGEKNPGSCYVISYYASSRRPPGRNQCFSRIEDPWAVSHNGE